MHYRQPAALLNALKQEALSKANLDMSREGIFRGVLRASFLRCFEFTSLVNKLKVDDAGEGSFFLSAALRGVSEDLITLKFIRQLKRKEREEVIQIKMMSSTAEVIDKQAVFFRKNRPLVLRSSFDAATLQGAKDKLAAIGQTSKSGHATETSSGRTDGQSGKPQAVLRFHLCRDL
jgi:hypothetical protein